MTDRKFQDLLDRLSTANEKYSRLRNEAEAEFERRFGANPSDVDCDPWIDTKPRRISPRVPNAGPFRFLRPLRAVRFLRFPGFRLRINRAIHDDEIAHP